MVLALEYLDSVGSKNITETPSLTDSFVGGVKKGLALSDAEDAIEERRKQKQVISNLPALTERVRKNAADIDAVTQLQQYAPKMLEYVGGLQKLDEATAQKRKDDLLENLAGGLLYIEGAEGRGQSKDQAWEEFREYNKAHNIDLGMDDGPWSDLMGAQLKARIQGVKSLTEGDKWMTPSFVDSQGRQWGVTEKGGWQPTGATGQPQADAPKTREVERDGVKYSEEWDAANRRWKVIGKSSTQKPGESFKDEQALRKEFNALNSAYREVEMARNNVTTSLGQNTAAGDLAAATAMMKMLDPGSVVRESELGMAMGATGAIDRIGNYAQMLQNGQRLNPQQRTEFTKLANALFSNADGTYQQRRNDYTALANEYGFKPENIIGRSAAQRPASSSPSAVKPAAKPAAKAKFLGFE